MLTPRFERENLRFDGGAGPSEADGELIIVLAWSGCVVLQ